MDTSNARQAWVGDVWGGLAAMLVALPSAIAFGVTIFSPLGSDFGPHGAMAGMFGATALGLIAATFGGTDRLITAPCAPAAALLAALTIDLSRQGHPPETVMLMLALIGLLAGALQIGFGLSGIGKLIRYIPYPVVSGYLSAVGITIIAGQLPRVLGADAALGAGHALLHPTGWHWESVLVGGVVIGVMIGAPRLIRAVPAAIVALLCGVLAYLALGWANPALWQTQGNPLLVGPLSAGAGQLFDTLLRQWQALSKGSPELLALVFMPALSLAALLSIDTLKTCVVLDAMTASHHNPNREMVGQGLGNIGSALLGGVPGAGTMGASLVNVSSGAQTRRSGAIAGLFALLACLLLSSLVAWVPIAALGAILLVIGYRMIDWRSLEFFRTASTQFDFLVILTVIAVALMFNLVAASGAGIVLAVLLFLREQSRSTVLRRKLEGSELFSRVVRHEIELQVLLRNGSKTVIVELQGALFFGTANQLYQALEPEIGQRTYVILNLRRVQSLDLTATHALEQIKARLEAAGAYLIFTEIPRGLPSGLKMKRYLKEVGLVRESENALAFRDLDQALEWIEQQMLNSEPGLVPTDEPPLELEDLEGLLGWKPGSLTSIAPIIETRQYEAGTKVLNLGGPEDELLFIRKGTVRVVLPLHGKDHWHIGTFGRGDFIGEMGFLDPSRRAADATALDTVVCFVLARHRFNELADSQSEAAAHIFEGIACVLAMRVRFMNKELRALRT